MILSAIAGGGALLEVGVLLVLGACLMSRQPLDDKKRFENNGTPTKFWTVALIGRRLLIASFILFIYMILVTIAGLIIGF